MKQIEENIKKVLYVAPDHTSQTAMFTAVELYRPKNILVDKSLKNQITKAFSQGFYKL